MTIRLQYELRRSFEKNAPELKALLRGQMPSFVTEVLKSSTINEIPVFVFHDIEPKQFEHQLLYLRDNNYQTLNADELEQLAHDGMSNGRKVALTFDDATWTFWAYAFPLLKRYHLQAILFSVPGIVPEDLTVYPNLEDVWAGRGILEDLARRSKTQPLCTWRELAIMHESGIVDIQSHSLTHARVPIYPRLVDFLHPDFDTYTSNFNVPISSQNNPEHPQRPLRLGAPVFESAPQMACRPRFNESSALVQTITGYVEEHGGVAFFSRRGWRRELLALFKKWPTQKLGSFDTQKDMEAAIRRELTRSKEILEERLVKSVRHFCYPWFAGSSLADRLAAKAGYRTVHYGPDINDRKEPSREVPLRIRRVSNGYLFRLPGKNRASILKIWLKRVCSSLISRIA
jgi:peptidoglycan/xylan/chitin deacetylase (PgdA/CDA1 family)